MWSVLSGANCIDGTAYENDGYALKLKRVRCPVKVSTCWPPNAKDQEGVPLDLSDAWCDTETVNPK